MIYESVEQANLIKILDSNIIIGRNNVFLVEKPIFKYIQRFNNLSEFEKFNSSCRFTKYELDYYNNNFQLLNYIWEWILNTRKLNENVTGDSNVFINIKNLTDLLANLIKESMNFLRNENIFGVECFIVYRNKVIFAWDYGKGYLPIVSKLSPEETNRVELVICIVPWRKAIIEGNRGYRNSLLEAGKLIFHLEKYLRKEKINFNTKLNFIDSEYERILRIDNVEIIPVAVIEVIKNG